ncbi:MAG: hypothetical protein IJC34_00640 [Lentisphaeria bacterium]|nr:hypothetical protein [Lentisphaeria bacterium]
MPHYLLDRRIIGEYCRRFNALDQELYSGDIPNREAESFLSANIPCFDCPDPVMQEIWYFRWWSFRKHIRSTPFGRVILEFMPDVPWAGPFNTINCPAAHQIREARWLKDQAIAGEYLHFWLDPAAGAEGRKYTFGPASAAMDLADVSGDFSLVSSLYPALVQNYSEWKKSHQLPDGLFWQIDNYDGMEISIGGSGIRATINSCMAGECFALSRIAGLCGKTADSEAFAREGAAIQCAMENTLWNHDAGFFMTRDAESRVQTDVRELHGFTPWYFLDMAPEYDIAWRLFSDPEGFSAPYGLTTAEQRHPGFVIAREGHECQWNGPVWPFATSVTLTGLARLLHRRQPGSVGKRAYFNALMTYARSHYLTENGQTLPWIDENMDPYNGSWLAREILQKDPSNTIAERGKDYSHSTFADLVIAGLCGVELSPDGVLTAHPLLPEKSWDHFLLDGLPVAGHSAAVQYDRDGSCYGRGAGLTLYVDGEAVDRCNAPDARVRFLLKRS